MNIKSSFINRSGKEIQTEYFEGINPTEQLEGRSLECVHGFCFCGDKLVIVYSEKKGYWSFPGGGIEKNEYWEDALIREVKEETNMKILYSEFIGFQDVYDENRIARQTRSFCVVEPYGDFTMDGDTEGGDVTAIKLIDPKEYKDYVNWGEILDHVIVRALDMKEKYDSRTRLG